MLTLISLVLFFVVVVLLPNLMAVWIYRLGALDDIELDDELLTLTNTDNSYSTNPEEKVPKTRLDKYHHMTIDDSLAKEPTHSCIGNIDNSNGNVYLQVGVLPYLLLSLAFLLLLWHHLWLACVFYIAHLLLLLLLFLPKN